jgi:hypothetical protein
MHVHNAEHGSNGVSDEHEAEERPVDQFPKCKKPQAAHL